MTTDKYLDEMIFLGRFSKSTRKRRPRDQETIADTSLRRRRRHINTTDFA